MPYSSLTILFVWCKWIKHKFKSTHMILCWFWGTSAQQFLRILKASVTDLRQRRSVSPRFPTTSSRTCWHATITSFNLLTCLSVEFFLQNNKKHWMIFKMWGCNLLQMTLVWNDSFIRTEEITIALYFNKKNISYSLLGPAWKSA